jgi:uncharacterized protein YndB with AHSA1/START domain
MKLNVLLTQNYPHPVEKVWRSLTDPAALAVWLMENDFEPHVGRKFTLRGRANETECEVLALEPPHRMLWSWVCNELDTPTHVEFRLEEIEGGTRLTLSHTGEIDDAMGARLTQGWPFKLADLRAHLDSAS